MALADCCRVYEQETVRAVTGPAIRPGGLTLTRRLIARGALPVGARVLDVGCGAAATAACLNTDYNLILVGLDPSPRLIQTGRSHYPDLPLLQARGERLPFDGGQFDAVMAECSLSLMDSLPQALAECYRVLRPGGTLILSDIYIRNAAAIPALRRLPIACCFRGARSQLEIIGQLKRLDFRLVLWEDHSQALKSLAGQIIWAYGSLAQFWTLTTVGQTDSGLIEQTIALAKPGYYGLIAEKKE